MAFNPFHRFRKHQKAIFAVMAIICMFVFILQFGRGDAIEKALGLLGYKGSRGDVVTTLYSKKVYDADLQTLAQQRQVASEFLQFLCEQGHQGALNDSNALFSKADDVQMLSLRQIFTQTAQNFFFIRFTGVGRNEGMFKQATQDIPRVESMGAALEFAKSNEKSRAIKSLTAAMEYLAWKYDPRLSKDELYFGGTPKNEDLLDFMVWQHQADKLGVVLDEEAVIKAGNLEAGGREVMTGKKFADEEVVKGFLSTRKSRAVTGAADLFKAVREEFRVALAQETLLGLEPGARAYRNATQRVPSPHQVPADGTPDEFLQYYREQRTTLSVSLLPVAVKDFVSRVEGKPSEQDLSRLYDRFKSVEPAPERREPGFKEPRRIRVEYISAKANSPLYKSLATQVLPFQENMPRIAVPVALPGVGGALTWVANAALPFALPADTILLSEYESYRGQIRAWDESFFRDTAYLHETSIQRPEIVRDMLGQLLASSVTRGSAFAAPATFYGAATLAEERDSIRYHTIKLMAFTSPTPFTAAALTLPFCPQAKPLDAVRGQLREKLVERLIPRVMEGNLEELKKELAKLKAKPAEAKALLTQLKDKNIFLDQAAVSMDALSDVYTVGDDPKLKPLKDAYESLRDKVPNPLPDFGRFLFFGSDKYDANYVIQPQPNGDTSQPDPFMFWRAEDKPARERPFDEVRADVEAAWRLQEARPLALKEAERIKQELLAKKLTVKDDIEKFLNDQKQGRPINLSNVAKLVPVRSPLIGRTEYERYRPAPSEVPHPPATLVNQLLAALEKPGDAVVIKDAPERTLYIVVLLVPRDDRRNFKEFADLYERTPDGDALWQNWFAVERRRDLRRKVMDQLRVEAGPVDAEGKFVVNENIKNRGDVGDIGE